MKLFNSLALAACLVLPLAACKKEDDDPSPSGPSTPPAPVPDAYFQAERLENTVEGLASSLEQAGTGAQEPAWDRLGDLAVPVLVLAGGDDAKFAALAARMTGAIGTNATLALVDGAGHAAHLEQPERFLAIVEPWLDRHGL